MQLTLNDLVKFSKEKMVSFHVWYSEAEDCFDIEITSDAPSERFYIKKVSIMTIEDLVEEYESRPNRCDV